MKENMAETDFLTLRKTSLCSGTSSGDVSVSGPPYCENPLDCFVAEPLVCSPDAPGGGENSGESAVCRDYQSFTDLIPRPYLYHPKSRERVSSLLGYAHRLQVFPLDLAEAYRAAGSGQGVQDGLARVHVYLLFHEALTLNRQLEDPAYRARHSWEVPFISPDFEQFAADSLEALKQEGALNIREVPRLRDELGLPLSGLYEELDERTLKISTEGRGDSLRDWDTYVAFHEIYHWYDFRNGKNSGSYEEKELRAGQEAMKALILLKRGEPIDWGEPIAKDSKPPSSPGGLDAFEGKINALKDPLTRVAFQLLWKKIRPFVEEGMKPSYIREICFGAVEELMGETSPQSWERAFQLLQKREFALGLVQETERLLRWVQLEPEKKNFALCDYSLPPKQNGAPFAPNQCPLGLPYIFSLALKQQYGLALRFLEVYFEEKK